MAFVPPEAETTEEKIVKHAQKVAVFYSALGANNFWIDDETKRELTVEYQRYLLGHDMASREAKHDGR